MLVYLVQHAKAKSKEEDPARPLTDEGRRDMEAVVLLLSRYGGITASRVVHSGKRRAEETARIIATKLDAELESAAGLAPNDDPKVWAGLLAGYDRDVVLVGHLPHLQRLASLLLCGDPERGVVAFAPAGVVALQENDGAWSVQWAIPPHLIQE